MMQQRRDEILAKKAKLAELKRQRELRASQATARQGINTSEVGPLLTLNRHRTDQPNNLVNIPDTRSGRQPTGDRDADQEPCW